MLVNSSDIHLHFLKPQNSITVLIQYIYIYINDVIRILLTLLLHCIVVMHVVCYKCDVLPSTSRVSLLFFFL